MEILQITDPAFRKYGRVITNVDFTGLVEELKKTDIPKGVVYEPSVPELEALPVRTQLRRVTYGEMPIQIGYCNGHNIMLNAVEYHRDSEINVAADEVVLLLGMLQDVAADFTYDTSKMEAFLIPAGTAVELYATTLHYAPCGRDGAGFRVAIVLPKGTNYPLEDKHEAMDNTGAMSEDSLLRAVNKWLIGHPEGGLEEGAFLGLKGFNLSIAE